MATTTVTHAAAGSITLTTTSITNGSYRQSTVIDNDTNGYLDAQVGGILTMGTTPTADSTCSIYAYASYDGTNYTAGCSGSDAAYTADGEESLLKLLETVTVDTTTDQEYVWGPVSVAQAFGGILPVKWGIVFKNDSGVTTNVTGTNNECQFTGITLDTA